MNALYPAGRRITLNNMLNYIQCPAKVMYSPNTCDYENNPFEYSLKAAFSSYFRDMRDYIIVNPITVRNTFASSYKLNCTYGIDSDSPEFRDMCYKSADIINMFCDKYRIKSEDVGFPEEIDGDFCMQCKCGMHYITGSFDLIMRVKGIDNITVYNFSQDKDSEHSLVPSVYTYIYRNVYRNPVQSSFTYYYPYTGKSKELIASEKDIALAGRLICSISESVYNKSLFKIENKLACMSCKYYQICRGVKVKSGSKDKNDRRHRV